MNLLDPREPVSTWSHALWLIIALAGMIMLWRRGRGDRAKQVSLLIYALCLILCSASSTLYHGVRLSNEKIEIIALMDHIAIYMLIAGTYTPIAWAFLRGHWRRGVLGLVWFWAILGITMHLRFESVPALLSTGLYLGMGWGAIFCYFEVARLLSHRALLPVLAGGVLYSLGAVINLLHEPVLWRGVFEAHELFHLFVVAGSLCHLYFILTVVGPYSMDYECNTVLADPPVLQTRFTARPASGQVAS